MLFLVVLVTLLGCGVTPLQSVEVLCMAKTPLVTPYIKYYGAKPTDCTGCVFPSKQTQKQTYASVHVVQADDPDGKLVELSVILANDRLAKLKSSEPFLSVVIVLSANRGERVTFFLGDIQGFNNVSYTFVVTGYNEVQAVDSSYKILYRKDWLSDAVVDKSRNEFGRVTSFTKAMAANSIQINVGLDFEALRSSDCSEGSSIKSVVAACSFVSPQSMAGCFHEDRIGSENSDVHIIDVDHSGRENGSLLLMVTGLPRNGITHRQPFLSDSKNILNKNVTLVLRSRTPTSWTIRVSHLEGHITLLVGGSDQVENTSSPSQSLSVSVKKVELPSSFDQLMLHVLSAVGPPVSYTKSKSPAMIKMFIPPRFDAREERGQRYNPHYNRGVRENADSLVKRSIVVDCLDTMAIISLPLRVAREVGGVFLSLKDPQCTSDQNQTHLFVKSSYSKCGFVPQTQPADTTFTNFVYLELAQKSLYVSDDEDFEGSGYGIDDHESVHVINVLVKCKSSYKTNATSHMVPDKYKYKMDLFHNENFMSAYSNADYPLSVPLDGLVHAKIDFIPAENNFDAVKINLLIEQCSLSDSAIYVTNSLTLVKKSCPIQPFVSLDTSVKPRSLGLHFAILDDIPLDKFYLHCHVGICASDSLPFPSLKKCVDPSSYCGNDRLMNIFMNQIASSLPQTVVVGPIVKLTASQTSTLEGIYTGAVFGHNQVKQSKKHSSSLLGVLDKRAPIIVVEGLSTEAVVGISIASFIIGVGLMATLWFIYMKTDPRRQRRPDSDVPRNSAYDAPENSGSSTPSSQAPMTA